MLPPRLAATELAALWKLTPQRISQFASKGQIVRGTDGKFDRDACLAFREAQISADEVRTLFQTVGNRHGTQPPKVLDHIGTVQAELSFDELLGIEPATPPPAASVIDKAYTKQSELTALKIEEGRDRLRRQRLKTDREEGLLIARAEVRRAGQNAAKMVLDILNGLPAEVAHLVDKEARAAVRRAVQVRIDQAHHALYEAISFAVDEDDDD